MVARGHADERGVERAAAQVVDHDVLAPGAQRPAVPVGVLEARGGRLVDERGDLEAGLAEGLQREEPLGRVGVRRRRDDRPDGPAAPQRAREIRAVAQALAERGEEAREQIGEPEARPAHGHQVRGGGGGERVRRDQPPRLVDRDEIVGGQPSQGRQRI